MKNKFLLGIFFSLMIGSGINAQTGGQAEQRATSELKRRGLDDKEVRDRLAKKGVDLNTIDPGDASAVMKAEKKLQEVIAEMEAEDAKGTAPKANTKAPTGRPKDDVQADTSKNGAIKEIAKQSEEVIDAVKKGSTLEEAVSETLIDNQGKALPPSKIYGQELFRSQNLKLYRKSEDVKPPASYILGVGDIVGVSIWGNSEESLILEINSDGYVKPNGIPRIYLKGIKYSDAKDLLRKRMTNYYSFREDQFELTLNFSRTINVSVVGETFNYGSFNIPAINTAFNALVAAGGPNDVGSVRNIKLHRAGQASKTIDIYKYLSNPSISNDFFLEENDIIFVPVAEKTVEIIGAVVRPFKYELLPQENLFDLINIAGGLQASAILQSIEVKRLENDIEVIYNVNLIDIMNKSSDFKLKKGDVIKINKIEKVFENFVTITGGVAVPGKYAYTKGMKLKDLLDKNILETNALLDLAYIKRKNDDKVTIKYIPINLSNLSFELKSLDELIVYTKDKFVESKYINISGAVRIPDSIAYDESGNLTVEQAIFLAGGLQDYAANFAYIKRKNIENPSDINFLRIDLLKALGSEKSNMEFQLKPYDSLIVMSKLTYTNNFNIKIDGEVRNPGEFPHNEYLTVRDVIDLAGGLKFEASKNRIDIYRVDIGDDKKTQIVAENIQINDDFTLKNNELFKLKPFDLIYVRKAPEFEIQRKVSIFGEIRYEGQYVIVKENERILDLINKAGGFTNEAFKEGVTIYRNKDGVGYIVADIEKALKNPNSEHNILLVESDIIRIPKNKDLVTISGWTKSGSMYDKEIVQEGKINVPFESGKSAMYYINKYAGGVNEGGDKNKVSVRGPNGKLSTTNRVFFFRKYPKVDKKGSYIYVGGKDEKKIDSQKEKTDWGQIFKDSVTQATSLLTLILLLNRI